ncbi:hypothetical protein ACLVWU_05705 [Bdellovibrio sp. HCB290]|uniref:hypothetical protein n=1 Tax=Bdellovibrio sp. HCB290 TaxID=3394356 RepID=UPI0039B525FA
MESVSAIYELLGVSPEQADQKARSLLLSAKTQADKDSINWARGFALVELKKFNEALDIWQEIFNRTHDHKALHQIGFVHRSSGNLSMAVNLFIQEQALISADDLQSRAINFYEQSYCNLLLGYNRKAQECFQRYEELNMDESDLIERGCFYRLKGDLHKSNDKALAKAAYEQSLNFFTQAEDSVASAEIKERLSGL